MVIIFFTTKKEIKINTQISDGFVDTQKIIPLSLIINEIITNSFKYAFPNTISGNIFIDFKQTEELNCLIIGDDGIGINPKEKRVGLGSKLITLFTKQLEGELTQKNDNGTVYTLCFPKAN